MRINFRTGAFNQAVRLLRLDVNLDGMHSSMVAEIACVKWFQFASTELASGKELKKSATKIALQYSMDTNSAPDQEWMT